MTHSSFTESFLLFSYLEVFLSPYSKECSQMSFLRYHRNSHFKLLNPRNGLTPWDECTHHKALSQKASLQLSWEDISLLTTGLWGTTRHPFAYYSRTSLHTGQCRRCFISVKWMHISESSFLECFFLGLFQDISLFTTLFHALQNITFLVLQEQCSNTAIWEKK